MTATIWVESSLFEGFRSELDEAGHRPRAFDEQLPPPSGVALIAGARRAEALAQRQIKLAVVAVVKPNELSYPLQAAADLVLEARAPGELAARISRLLARDAPGFRVHLLTRAVDFAGDIIELGTTSAVLQYVNPAFERVLGVPARAAEGRTPGELVRSNHHSPEFFQELDRTLAEGRVWSGHIVSKSADGRLVHLDTTVAPVKDRSGHITHHVAVKRDVSDRVARERALEQANRELTAARDTAVAASKTKSEFLANMSHELRTPLNAIIGYGELLMEDAEEANDLGLHDDLRKIRNAGRHLLNLINDVLDMSKIESGKMPLELVVVDLTALIAEVTETIEPLADKSGNILEADVERAPRKLLCDPHKLRQVLTNLLSNACKFTRDGRIRVVAEADSQGAVSLSVSDTGIGMSEEQLSRVFEPFVQADTSTTRRYGGTGLGLSISKRFCEMMGGTLEVVSQPGAGSTFAVRLPNAVATPSVRQTG